MYAVSNSSGKYNFQSVEVELLIREAYENIGISPEDVTPQKLESARRSINLILLEWMNKSTNLWSLHNGFIGLEEGRSRYELDNYVSDIIDVSIRSSTRQLNGTAYSSNGGDAANAFDSNPETTCTQDAPNGNISYDYGDAGTGMKISFCGIVSHANLSYNFDIEYSDDNVTWHNLYSIGKKDFKANILYWFDIPVERSARYYRIRETGGATLNIQEIYFNNNVSDIKLGNISRDEYFSYADKSIEGRPSSYYFDKSIIPALNLWPAPSHNYNAIIYSYKRMLQDVGLYTNTLEVPSRFYPALVAALSYRLAIKFNIEIADMLAREYESSYRIAEIEDTESVDITIRPMWH